MQLLILISERGLLDGPVMAASLLAWVYAKLTQPLTEASYIVVLIVSSGPRLKL